ncbi:ATP-binding protein [Christensenella timonensis]|uniref:ATP-binding protein n=1 Tax=Christensenella timonensis TaxID=1816678 RepID=UPI00082B315C|nr:ATP-binding protein [Christensenella timonensis]
MNYETECLIPDRFDQVLHLGENYFNELKSKDIKPSRLSKTVSAFANASGGDIYIGIEEETRTKKRTYNGFASIEEANGIVQMLLELAPLENFYAITFLKHPVMNSYILQLTVMKTAAIVYATDGTAYVRHNAQNDPANTPEKLRRLELDKGIAQFENESIPEAMLVDATASKIMDFFSSNVVPNIEKTQWLIKQKLVRDHSLTVAGVMLFTDEPQIFLPKRSAIKLYRYKTSFVADRDNLDGQPLTIEGSVYTQIYDAVKKVKEIIEGIKKLGIGFESIEYPDETLHEIITNAVLHRDYSIATDIQIRIFDNRVEVESPGKLPGYVTISNILDSQTARNPKIVRLVNKFPSAPNKDVGEGLNTAFEAMEKLRLKPPIITETDTSVLVVIRHEKLASPEEIIVEYLQTHDSIKNGIGRVITGIKSENSMKTVFYRLRDRGFIKLVRGYNYWVKTDQFDRLVTEQFK